MIPKFQLVLLHCPSQSWKDPEVRKHFVAMAQLKIKGYGQVYPPDRVLPLDTYDWIASHVLVYMHLPDGVKLVLAYKFIELSTCQQYGLPLSFISHLTHSTPEHNEALQKILLPLEQKGGSLAYFSGWAIEPLIRPMAWAREFNAVAALGLLVPIHHEFKIDESVSIGAAKVKAYELLQKAGYELLKNSAGEVLPPLVVPSMNNELAYPLHLAKFTPEVMEFAQRIADAWDKRIELGTYPKSGLNLPKKKAA